MNCSLTCAAALLGMWTKLAHLLQFMSTLVLLPASNVALLQAAAPCKPPTARRLVVPFCCCFTAGLHSEGHTDQMLH